MKTSFQISSSWAVLVDADPSGDEWEYVQYEIWNAVKEMNPSFADQLHKEIDIINQT